MVDDQTLEEFAQRYADAWGSHDPAQVASFYAPAGTISINGGPRTSIADAANGFISAFPDIQVFMESVVRNGETVEFRWTFTGTNTGPEVPGNGCGSLDSRSGSSATTAWWLSRRGTTTRPSTSGNWHTAALSRSQALRFAPLRRVPTAFPFLFDGL